MADDTVALAARLEARLDQFERDMKKAGVIADDTVKDIESKFANANPQIKTIALGNFFGNLAAQAPKAIFDLVAELYDRFKKLEINARLAGIAMNDAFGFEEAAKKANVPVEEAAKFIRQLAQLTDEAKRGDKNSLTDLFEQAKPLIGEVDLKTLTWQKSLDLAAEAAKQAGSEIQKIDITKAAGGSESLAKFLALGSVKINEMQKAAADAAPDLQKLANEAKEIDALFQSIVKWAGEKFREAIRGTIETFTTLAQAIADFLASIRDSGWAKEGSAIDRAAKAWAGVAASMKEAFTTSDKSADKVERESARAGNLASGKGTTTADPNKPILNYKRQKDTDDAADTAAFDRAVDQMNKSIALRDAETASVGKSAAAHAELRTRATLLAAVQKDGAEATKEQSDKIDELAAKAAAAAARFEEAQRKFQGAQEALRFAGQTASQEIQALIDKSKTLGDVLTSVLKKIAAALIDAGLWGGGPLAKLLGLAGEGGRVGGIAGGMMGDGGTIESGQYAIAGERGVPEIITAKNTGLDIRPIAQVSGGMNFAITSVNDFRGLTSDMKAWINAQLEQRDRQLPNMIAAHVPNLRKHSKLM